MLPRPDRATHLATRDADIPELEIVHCRKLGEFAQMASVPAVTIPRQAEEAYHATYGAPAAERSRVSRCE
jgi:hypothetical protein